MTRIATKKKNAARTKIVTRTRTVLSVDAVAGVEVETVRSANVVVAVVVIEPVDALVALKNLAVAGHVAPETVGGDRVAQKAVGIAIVTADVDHRHPSRNRPRR